MGKILLFYKYVAIEYPKQIVKWQVKLCSELNLKGRIYIAHEGINATVGGSAENCQRYIEAMNNHPLFGNIDFKESPGAPDYFPRLRVVEKKEIVHLGLDTQLFTADQGGKHLSPQEAHELMEQKNKELVIIDCRNSYETAIGTFDNALRPDTKYFREFPEYVDKNIDLFKDKEVLMACTGGIRCERASAYLKAKGVAQEIYQIQGGIHRYAEQFPDGFFKGKNYVFDARITMKVSDDILGKCELCQTPCDEYVNCLNASCNKHFISCNACEEKYKTTCGSLCHDLVYQNKVKMRPPRIKINHIDSQKAE